MRDITFLLLTGVLDRAGTFTLRRAQTALTVRAWPHVTASQLRLESLDAEHHVIASEEAELRPRTTCSAADSDDWRVYAAIALRDDAASIQLVWNERVIWSRTLPEPPTLELLELKTFHRKERQVSLRMDFSAPEDEAWMAVIYQWGTQRMHRMVYVGEPLRTMQLGLNDMPGGDECVIRIAYSNGLRSATVNSEPFSMPPLGPRLDILKPADGARVRFGVPVELQASILDEERVGGARPGDLVWWVDGKVIASGHSACTSLLGIGNHEIRVEYGAPVEARAVVRVAVERVGDAPIADEWRDWNPVLGRPA
ncbi:MAG TPA: hypothetical protein VGN46_05695 [Luteibacter sp.]|jgi:hypothetical protein|uniref:hypothetical protein n=1 Tax=Luteibacter sp. TaxID=1886636 RepID=UPI002F3FA713